jgi:hypothetical protein
MDKQLAKCRRTKDEIQLRMAANLPVTVKELAIALEVSYHTMRNDSKEEGFPFWRNQLIFPNDFQLWRQQRLGLASAPQTPARPQGNAAGKRD